MSSGALIFITLPVAVSKSALVNEEESPFFNTSEFMTAFYTQWLQKGLGIPEAFRKAQHDLRLKYPGNAYHWAGFVLVE